MTSLKLTKDSLKKISTKVKEAIFRTEKERQFLLRSIKNLEDRKTKQNLIKWLVENIPTILKKNTLFDFMRIFDEIKKGHPSMTNSLKNNLQDISDLEIQKAYLDTYKNQ